MKEPLKYNSYSMAFSVAGILFASLINNTVGVAIFGIGFIANVIMFAVILRRKK